MIIELQELGTQTLCGRDVRTMLNCSNEMTQVVWRKGAAEATKRGEIWGQGMLLIANARQLKESAKDHPKERMVFIEGTRQVGTVFST